MTLRHLTEWFDATRSQNAVRCRWWRGKYCRLADDTVVATRTPYEAAVRWQTSVVVSIPQLLHYWYWGIKYASCSMSDKQWTGIPWSRALKFKIPETVPEGAIWQTGITSSRHLAAPRRTNGSQVISLTPAILYFCTTIYACTVYLNLHGSSLGLKGKNSVVLQPSAKPSLWPSQDLYDIQISITHWLRTGKTIV